MRGKVHIDLGGHDGNPFVLLGIANGILHDSGRSDEYAAIEADAKSGDYANLVAVLLREVGDATVRERWDKVRISHCTEVRPKGLLSALRFHQFNELLP